jgi:glutaconate CoA-transferase, subunit B
VSTYTADDMMTVAAARQLGDGTVCFVGIGIPSLAANVARSLHAPDCVLIYESGCIGAKPTTPPLSIGDGELADTADAVVSVPEIFNYWLQAGRIDVGFLSAAQIDRFANLNTTVVGPYDQPQVRLPGAGGAPEIASSARRVIVVLRQSRRTFVERLDFITTAGHLTGGDARRRLGLPGEGPTLVITDLGLLTPDPDTKELQLSAIHPGVAVSDVKNATGWSLKVVHDLQETDPPTARELEALRRLQEPKVPTLVRKEPA